MIQFVCDRCGSILPPGARAGYVCLDHQAPAIGDLEGKNPCDKMHFCADCMREIRDFVMNPPESVSEQPENVTEQPENVIEPGPPEKKKEGRKRVDYGKIMALRDAGWDAAKIADEMQMTKAAVYTAISTFKKKHAERGDENE